MDMLKAESNIDAFVARVKHLLLKFTELKKENEELYSMIDERDKQITELKKQLDEAEKKYDVLMMTKMLSIADADIENTKKRVNKLIRAVNQCITLVSEQ